MMLLVYIWYIFEDYKVFIEITLLMFHNFFYNRPKSAF